MLISFALIFIVGLAMAEICRKIKLPHIIGMIVTGVVLGPYVLNLLDSSILGISADLRRIALVIIIIKAGLSLNISDLKKVGRPALLMSFIPATCEIIAFIFFAPLLLGINHVEAAVMGAVMGAVSPAVVVPRMVQLIDNGYGTDKGIPQMILAGASMDDIFVIVLFSTFVNMDQGNSVSLISFANVPVSIILGILVGAATGFLVAKFFKIDYKHQNSINNSKKVLIILGVAFLLVSLEEMLKGVIAFSGLLAVMSMAVITKIIIESNISKCLAENFGKIWIAAEIILFVLVGAAVNINYLSNIGIIPVLMILIALVFRSVGVLACLIKTKLNFKERLFCVISYLPKATVQAAIGSIPLSLGLSCGNIVLTMAVLGIVITAPIGAIGMEVTYKKLLLNK